MKKVLEHQYLQILLLFQKRQNGQNLTNLIQRFFKTVNISITSFGTKYEQRCFEESEGFLAVQYIIIITIFAT